DAVLPLTSCSFCNVRMKILSLIGIAFCLSVLYSCQALFAAPLAIGTVQSLSSRSQGCLNDSSCETLEVRCPDVQNPASALIAVASHNAAARGLIVFFSGGGGENW